MDMEKLRGWIDDSDLLSDEKGENGWERKMSPSVGGEKTGTMSSNTGDKKGIRIGQEWKLKENKSGAQALRRKSGTS